MKRKELSLLKDISLMDINEIKSLHEVLISKEDFKKLLLNKEVVDVDKYAENDYFIETVDGDYFEVYVED